MIYWTSCAMSVVTAGKSANVSRGGTVLLIICTVLTILRRSACEPSVPREASWSIVSRHVSHVVGMISEFVTLVMIVCATVSASICTGLLQMRWLGSLACHGIGCCMATSRALVVSRFIRIRAKAAASTWLRESSILLSRCRLLSIIVVVMLISVLVGCLVLRCKAIRGGRKGTGLRLLLLWLLLQQVLILAGGNSLLPKGIVRLLLGNRRLCLNATVTVSSELVI